MSDSDTTKEKEISSDSSVTPESEEDTRSKKFHYEIKELFNFLRDIHRKESSKKINLSNKNNPFMKSLDNYEKFYDKSEPEDHMPFFSDLFDKYRNSILSSYENDDWICENTIVIEIPNSKIKRAIQLTIFYMKALALQKDAQDNINKLPLKAQEKALEQADEIDYPSILICRLYRIFSYCCELNVDREKLNIMLVEMETDLDIGVTVSQPQNSLPGMNGFDAKNLGNMIGSLINGLRDSIPEQEGEKIPNGDEISGFISNVLNNPNLQKTVGGLMKGVTSQNPKDSQDVMENLVKSISGPDVKDTINEIIKTSVEKSAEQKIESKEYNTQDDHSGE